MYLMKYGYMDMAGGSGKSAPLLSRDGLRNYIREFQVGSWLNRSMTEQTEENFKTDPKTYDQTLHLGFWRS